MLTRVFSRLPVKSARRSQGALIGKKLIVSEYRLKAPACQALHLPPAERGFRPSRASGDQGPEVRVRIFGPLQKQKRAWPPLTSHEELKKSGEPFPTAGLFVTSRLVSFRKT